MPSTSTTTSRPCTRTSTYPPRCSSGQRPERGRGGLWGLARKSERESGSQYSTSGVRRRLTMQFKRLGQTELKVSRICFGTWQVGGDWGEIDAEQARAAVRRALELGVNFFD